MFLEYDDLEFRICTLEPFTVNVIHEQVVKDLIKMAELFKIKLLLQLEED
jgi:hypothetical protein